MYNFAKELPYIIHNHSLELINSLYWLFYSIKQKHIVHDSLIIMKASQFCFIISLSKQINKRLYCKLQKQDVIESSVYKTSLLHIQILFTQNYSFK